MTAPRRAGRGRLARFAPVVSDPAVVDPAVVDRVEATATVEEMVGGCIGQHNVDEMSGSMLASRSLRCVSAPVVGRSVVDAGQAEHGLPRRTTGNLGSFRRSATETAEISKGP